MFTFTIGNRYNWKNQPERLIYKGTITDPTGLWHAFCLVDDASKKTWCEVRTSDLEFFEETK
jgi:hypothetical protein